MPIKIIVVTLPILLLFSGCFSNEAPKCSDPAVKKMVKNLYEESLEELSTNPMAIIFMQSLPKRMLSLSAVRPMAYDEKIHLRACKAKARFDNNISSDIEYSVQLSEENPKEFYVELDTTFMEGLMQQSMIQGVFK